MNEYETPKAPVRDVIERLCASTDYELLAYIPDGVIGDRGHRPVAILEYNNNAHILFIDSDGRFVGQAGVSAAFGAVRHFVQITAKPGYFEIEPLSE